LIIAVAFGLDVSSVRPPGPRRQVNEDWLGTYRDWVIGFGFGAQLGAGVSTYVMVWATWALLISALFVGLPGAGAMGVMFGAGRAVLLLRTRHVETSVDLNRSMSSFATFEPRARMITNVGYTVVLAIGAGFGLGS
jgi:hypothetical protein